MVYQQTGVTRKFFLHHFESTEKEELILSSYSDCQNDTKIIIPVAKSGTLITADFFFPKNEIS